MYVMKNPVISKMYAHCGLTLSEYGLHFYLTADPTYYFKITDNHIRIAEIMGFDYAELDAAKEYSEFFQLLMKNQYFRPSRFATDNTEGHVRMFKELAELLTANPVYKGYTTRQIPDMFDALSEFHFEERYKRLLELVQHEKAIKAKFNGGVVLRIKPDFDRHKLEEGFNKFNGSRFETKLDRCEFIYSHTQEEIVEEFIKLLA